MEPAVGLAASGIPGTVVLECLAERTLVAGLRDRERGYDPRLERRFTPLLPAADGCRVVTNLGAANPEAAARRTAELARELGLDRKVAAVVGDDVASMIDAVAWSREGAGSARAGAAAWLGARAYLGADALEEAVAEGADVIITGRVADAALFAAPVLWPTAPRFGGPTQPADLALALTVGHLLECAGQVTGGNFEPPGGGGLPADELARLGYPLATLHDDGTAELFVLDDAPARLDPLTCTLQLLYEVHDPAAYVTPDAILDFTGVRFEPTAPNRVRVSGARAAGRPAQLKVSGFLERPGAVADVEIAYAGRGALDRARRAADVLRARLEALGVDEWQVDLVGVDSVLGAASPPPAAEPPELRVHASAACEDEALAQAVEDEVFTLTIAGPAAGGAIRSERRAPRLEVVGGLVDRALVQPRTVWV